MDIVQFYSAVMCSFCLRGSNSINSKYYRGQIIEVEWDEEGSGSGDYYYCYYDVY